MAKAIQVIHSPDSTAQVAQGIATQSTVNGLMDDIIAKHQSSVERGLTLLTELEQAGILDMLVAALHQREDILEQLLQEERRGGIVNGIKVVVAGLQSLTTMDTSALSTVLSGVDAGAKSLNTTNGPRIDGMWDLFKALRDPDVQQGISVILSFLQGFGRGVRTHHTGAEEV